jgi:hypothetical protein
LIVDRDEHQGEFPDGGEIHRLPKIALGRGAIAEQAHGDPRLASELESIGDTRGMRRLGGDRDAIGKIMGRSRRAVAALVAAPEQENLLHLHAAPDERRIVAVGWQEYVLRPHRARDPDRDCFLPESHRIGAEPAGALQRHRLEVEGPRLDHGAIERDQEADIGGERGQRPCDGAVGREMEAAMHLEPGNDRKLVGRWPRIFCHVMPPDTCRPARRRTPALQSMGSASVAACSPD